MKAWSRSDRSFFSRWWWTIDRVSFVSVLVLLALGLMLVLAFSPAVADRKDLSHYHFLTRQLLFVGPGLVAILGLSLLPLRAVKAVAAVLFAVSFALVVATHFFAPNTNGAHRWLYIGAFGFQPSEFLKPGLVVLLAWILNEQTKLRQSLKFLLASAAAFIAVLPIALQPDYGQSFLILLVWAGMMFIAGLPAYWFVGLAGLAAAGAVAVYSSVDHVARRIDGFLDPSSTDTYQVDTATKAIESGGIWGVGPGEGEVKLRLPDSHTDFIFAATAEEFGMMFCLFLIGVFVFFVVRGMTRAMAEPNHFAQLAGAGLVSLIGLQAFINIGVNVELLPNKGMTLPFISYGGSSLLASAVMAGLLLACTRKRLRGGLPRYLRQREALA